MNEKKHKVSIIGLLSGGEQIIVIDIGHGASGFGYLARGL
jgi:hypothetical protein